MSVFFFSDHFLNLSFSTCLFVLEDPHFSSCVLLSFQDFSNFIPDSSQLEYTQECKVWADGVILSELVGVNSKARGTGIGLAVSDEIVQMHGGELILENALTGGTLVTVRLPATQ